MFHSNTAASIFKLIEFCPGIIIKIVLDFTLHNHIFFLYVAYLFM